jgi:putative hemolysin
MASPIGWLFPAALVGILILFSALFSAVETAFFALQPAHLRRLKETRPALAEQLDRLLENPRRLLSTLLLADVCVNLPLILLCLWLLREGTHTGLSFWGGALVIFAVVVFVCDFLPKMIALGAPLRITKLGLRVVNRIVPVLDPISRTLQAVSDRVADALTPRSFAKAQPLDESELETLIEISAEEGALQIAESEMIQEILKLGDKTARDCMLPRIDVFAIPDDLTNDEVLPRLHIKRFRRVPVYADTPDQIVGILDVERFLLDPERHYTEHLTPPSYVPETMKALNLLRSFLTHPQRLAIVVDEFGGTEGIVTLPDMIEHIVSDAVPSSRQELYIETFGTHGLIAAGDARLDDLSERLGLDLETDGIDTIGGLIFNQLGYVPQAGESLTLGSLRITVRRATRKRVQEVLIEPPQPSETETAEEAESP